MKSFSTAARLSVALVCLTTTIMLAGQSLGLVPDGSRALIRGRKELCETIAVYCSQATQNGDIAAIRATARVVMSRNPDILSMAVVRADGQEVFEVGDHRDNWKPLPSDVSTATQVQVPIFEHQDRWGTVEIRFAPMQKGATLGFLESPAFRLTVFVAVAGYIAYLLYLRKTLRVLDPSSVIPDRVKAMLETLAEGVLVLDRQERIVLANQAFAAIVGRLPSDLQGLDASQLKWTLPHSDERPKVLPWTTALRTGELQKGIPLTLIGGPRGSRTVTVNAAPITASDGNGRARGVLLTIDDVTMIEAKNAQLKDMLDMLRRSRDEIDRQNKELQAAATTDPLTACRNRRAFYEDFQKAWSAVNRHQRDVSCVMVDVDHFKRVNDVHGHAAGDMVLQFVAGLLKSMARETDVVCRYGGEEFSILLPETNLDDAARAGERFRRAIAEKSCGSISVTASVGCAGTGHGADSPSQLMEQADKALYAAKRTGRNRVVRFDRMPMNVPELPARSRDMEGDLAAGGSGSRAGGDRDGTGDAPIAFHAVTALMSALGHRDKQTAEHCRRVADLCVAAGRSLLSLRDCFVLEVAAMLHDVGKLGVPDSILLKPGPLTDDEWKVMKTHDRMGMEITAAAFGSDELTRIVRMHHARFGGGGRDPDMPSGQEIPVAARILSIADAYDAMVSDRPYRRALTPEQAFKELRGCAGRQFDPELVEHFITAVSASSMPGSMSATRSAVFAAKSAGSPEAGGASPGDSAAMSSPAASGTASPFAKVRAMQHSSQASLEGAMNDLHDSVNDALENNLDSDVENVVRSSAGNPPRPAAQPESIQMKTTPISRVQDPAVNSTAVAAEVDTDTLDFADSAPAAPAELPAKPKLGRWSKAASRPRAAAAAASGSVKAASSSSANSPVVARAPIVIAGSTARATSDTWRSHSSKATAPKAAETSIASSSHGDLSDERALRLRLEIERLACAAEAGALDSLTSMAASLCVSARTDGLSQVADRASSLERSAAIADADSIVRVTNELLTLCRSAHQLDTTLNRGIRRRVAWKPRGGSQDAASSISEDPKHDAEFENLLDGTATDVDAVVSALKCEEPAPLPLPARKNAARVSAPAPAAAAATAEIVPARPRQFSSPFAVKPLTLSDKTRTAPEPLELDQDVMHAILDENPVESAAADIASEESAAQGSGPRMVKVTSMTHLPGAPAPGSAQSCIVVRAEDLKDCSINAA